MYSYPFNTMPLDFIMLLYTEVNYMWLPESEKTSHVVNKLCPIPRMLPDCAVSSCRENKERSVSPPWLFVTIKHSARRPARLVTKTFQSFYVALTIRQAPVMTCEPIHLRTHYAL